ncbi:MAG: hypothetical protein K9J85_06830 [Desulfobacteraceae bacterium]|nr:hypothetical protein [Desulfobacteraceae bacterium]
MLYFLRRLAAAALLAANRLLLRILNTVIPDSGIDESYLDEEVFAAAEDLLPQTGDQFPEPWAKHIQNAEQAVWFNYKVQNARSLQQNQQINFAGRKAAGRNSTSLHKTEPAGIDAAFPQNDNEGAGYAERIFDPETQLWVKQKHKEQPVHRTAVRQSPKTRAKTTRAEKNKTTSMETFKFPEPSDAMAPEPEPAQEPGPDLSESLMHRQSYGYQDTKAVQPDHGLFSRSEQRPAESPPGGSWPELETFTPCPEETEAPFKSFKSTDRLMRLKSEQQGSLWSVLRF